MPCSGSIEVRTVIDKDLTLGVCVRKKEREREAETDAGVFGPLLFCSGSFSGMAWPTLAMASPICYQNKYLSEVVTYVNDFNDGWWAQTPLV